MAFLPSKTRIRTRQVSSGGGGRGPTDYWPGGGGGSGGRGGDEDLPSYRERLRRYRMLIAFGLTSVVMIFVAFTTAYVVRKAGGGIWDPVHNEYASDWVPTTLPVTILLANTLVLLISSMTLEVARRRAAEDVVLGPIADIPGIRVGENRSLPWVWATIALGLVFLGGQYLAWRRLSLSHINIETNISSSFFFILTGVHAVHLLGGILALLYAGLTAWLLRPPETRRIVIDVTAWYWHFMGVLWIYVFALLYFGR
jgi:cytochrome c oxidase subunit III